MARGAYADAYQVAWSTDSDGTQWCFVVSPDNEFDATLYALGLGMYPLSQDQRAYLSSAEYGGMFYTISQRWAPIQHYLSEYEGSSLYTQFLAFVMDTPLMQVTYNIMGMDAYTNVWTATISDAEKEQAQQDFNDVVNGNIGGGGGSGGPTVGGVTGNNFTLNLNNYVYQFENGGSGSYVTSYNGVVYYLYSNATTQSNYPNGWSCNITVSGVDTSTYSDALVIYRPNGSMKDGRGIYTRTVYMLRPNTYTLNVDDSTNKIYVDVSSDYKYSSISNNLYTMSSFPMQFVDTVSDWYTYSSDFNINFGCLASISGGGGGTPTPPENDWPGDDDDQPTAPRLPVINIPGITLPTLPTITLDPTININVNDPTNTTPTDYTPWLKAIKDTLTDGFDNLYSELSEHCYHLQEQMQHQALYIADSITDYMEECITTLVTDMQAIARYIVESLTYYFGNGSYNDNNVIYWLRRIWMRLGGGSPSPVNEPEDAWDWFTKLIVGLLADIMAAGSDLAADVAELISQVMTKFPFSIPWDIAAILGLFAATPVTPHFEVPVNVPNVVDTTLVIDLGFLDGAMATVRAFELIAFAVYLLWMTKDIVKIFDETGFV